MLNRLLGGGGFGESQEDDDRDVPMVASSRIQEELGWSGELGQIEGSSKRVSARANVQTEDEDDDGYDSMNEGELDMGYLLDDSQLLLRTSTIQHLVDDILPSFFRSSSAPARTHSDGYDGTESRVLGATEDPHDPLVSQELESLLSDEQPSPADEEIRSIRMDPRVHSVGRRKRHAAKVEARNSTLSTDSRTLRVPNWRQIQWAMQKQHKRNEKLSKAVLQKYLQEDLVWTLISVATIVALLALSFGLLFVLPLLITDLDHKQSGLVAVTIFMVMLWTFKPFSVEAGYTALLVMLLLMVTGIAPSKVVLTGGAQDAFWILVCGMFISGAIKDTTITLRLSRLIMMLVPSKHLLIFVLIVIGGIMGILVPSGMVRVLLASEMGDGIIAQVSKGKKPSPATRTAVYGAIYFSTLYCGYASMTGNVATLVTFNALTNASANAALHVTVPSWGLWFVYMAPTCLVLEMFLLFVGIELLAGWRKDCLPGYRRLPFSGKPSTEDAESAASASSSTAPSASSPKGELKGYIKISEVLIALITLITSLMWAIESYIGLTTLWVAIGSVLILHAPLVGPSQFKLRTANIMLLILLAVIIGVGAAYQQTCLDKDGHPVVPCNMTEMAPLSNTLKSWMIKFVNLSSVRVVKLYLLFLFVTFSAWILAIGPTCGILIPMIIEIAQKDLDLDYFTASLTGPLAAMAVLLPAQAAPILVAFLTGKIRKLPFILLVIWTGITSILFIAPLSIGWWELLKLIGL